MGIPIAKLGGIHSFRPMLDQLLAILKRNAPAEGATWLDDFMVNQFMGFNQRQFYFAFSGATRRFPKTELTVSQDELAALGRRLAGFTVEGWTTDQLARVSLLVTLADQDREVFLESLRALQDTADMREAVAIYSAFPLLPYPEELVPLAREGLRSNITSVFDSIALRNPFPAAHFDEEGWNQMVLKALFISRPLWKIHGFDARANAALADALRYLAHERWSAGRSFSPELWRGCARFVTEAWTEDVRRVAGSEEPGQREAAALMVHAAGLNSLRELLAPELERVAAGKLTWDSLGQ